MERVEDNLTVVEEGGSTLQPREWSLTSEQNSVLQQLLDDVINATSSMFFLEGSGGSGKTTVLKKLCAAVQDMGKEYACCAPTGVAARLLPNGVTSHRLFGIPVPYKMDSVLNPSQGSERLLKQVDVLIWDEATMSERGIIEKADLTLRKLRNRDVSFGGLTVVFGGDWKQTLPVARGNIGVKIVEYTLRGSSLWSHIKHLRLSTNMRASGDTFFSGWLTDVGRGGRVDLKQLPSQCIVQSENELIHEVFGCTGSPEDKREIFSTAAILTPDNDSSMETSEKVLDLLTTPVVEFLSIDTHIGQKYAPLDTTVYNRETPTGLPPHRLRLKIGAAVILLRNINVPKGMCNGTRLIVEEFHDNYIMLSFADRPRDVNDFVKLKQKSLAPVVPTEKTSFSRVQYPLRLAFAMTCHKSQGQTIERVGLLLRRQCFVHGQLYVALSRVRSCSSLFVYNASNKTTLRNVVLKNMI